MSFIPTLDRQGVDPRYIPGKPRFSSGRELSDEDRAELAVPAYYKLVFVISALAIVLIGIYPAVISNLI